MPRPACENTKNKAFSNPTKATPQAVRAAQKICHHCPLLKACAKDALTSGTTLSEDYRAPASDVIQAGVICTGDDETARRLSIIAGVETPTYRRERPQRPIIGSKRGDTCRHCNQPMIKWNRHEQQPDGYRKHYARGFCEQCRGPYREWKKANPAADTPRGLRKPLDRKRHSAPPRKKGVPTVQLALFDTSTT
ncbi:hypothetical protein CPHO_08450 [Corynebacterium phocae]|uniref:4Fe-4S Wbl-type domain-containing protein n=1 Tax=Corynebacterium phocae TaxID=161895 RepID=A0A1L7D4R8_9CORY|nr:WhiB family transcriptional regulator [Corynebacterium phocae]APT92912.1 hypothetical protein CPHO_08450 [Corynebacterium phocae]KAA8723238.1 hypothetical protein F4V58_07950 [Corynebacterium phocae]